MFLFCLVTRSYVPVLHVVASLSLTLAGAAGSRCTSLRGGPRRAPALALTTNTQICGEAHSTFFHGCDCGCCESYWQEAFSTCQSCRQHEIIRDRILESKGDPPPAVILTAEGLDRAFPQQFRPDWHKKVAKAKGSHFNFSFDK